MAWSSEAKMSEGKVPRLEEFDARIVRAPLQGLLRNIDSEITRQLKTTIGMQDKASERKLSLLLTMLRFTKNSYEAISFLSSSMDDSAKRKREFVLILPPANRQLLDLLFTLVFMLDEFPERSMAYELSGYRQAREEYDKYHERFGTNLKWKRRFASLDALRRDMEKYLSVTPFQMEKPKSIPYWRAPYRLMQQTTKSKPFMQFLEKWLYGETSAQAHLNPAGLFSVGAFVLTDFASEEERKTLLEIRLHQYTFRHFTRTLTTVLAIVSEIDSFLKLGNNETLARLWVLLSGYADESQDVYHERYQSMLNSN
jgi:hypothetical protein